MELDQHRGKVRGGAFALKYVLTVTASAIAELGMSDGQILFDSLFIII